jgi:XTP/dITP diphosphohydrolase
MTMTLPIIFATNNVHKIEEVRASLGQTFALQTMKEAGIDIDIPEPHATLEANAAEKARVIARLTGRDAFSEDSGLEVRCLMGEPGVKSARYAGDHRSDQDNIKLLLERLHGHTDRRAQFRTIMFLILDGKEYCFEGVCSGTILMIPEGSHGFGYDPIFVPDGASESFATMGLLEKNKFSHRRKALDQLITFLKKQHYGQG